MLFDILCEHFEDETLKRYFSVTVKGILFITNRKILYKDRLHEKAEETYHSLYKISYLSQHIILKSNWQHYFR